MGIHMWWNINYWWIILEERLICKLDYESFFSESTNNLGHNLLREELERKNVRMFSHSPSCMHKCPRPCGGRIACRLDTAGLRKGGRGLLEAPSWGPLYNCLRQAVKYCWDFKIYQTFSTVKTIQARSFCLTTL